MGRITGFEREFAQALGFSCPVRQRVSCKGGSPIHATRSREKDTQLGRALSEITMGIVTGSNRAELKLGHGFCL